MQLICLMLWISFLVAAEPPKPENLDTPKGFVWGYVAREVSWIEQTSDNRFHLVRADVVCTDKTEQRCAALRQYLVPLPRLNYMIFQQKDFPLGSRKAPTDEKPWRLVSPGIVVPAMQKLLRQRL